MFFSGRAGARKYWLALVILALAACQPEIDSSTLPAPKTWQVQVTPALRWLGPVMNECTRQVPGIALLYDEEPASALDLKVADLPSAWRIRSKAPPIPLSWHRLA